MARIRFSLRTCALVVLSFSLLALSAVASAAQSGRIQLSLHESQQLSLPESVHQLKIDNEYIASLLSDRREVFIQARGLGQSRLSLLDRDGKLIRQYQVEVTANLDDLRAILKAAMPGERVKVEQLQDKLLLSGSISSEQRREQILRLIEGFLRPEFQHSGGNFTTVVDQLRLGDSAAIQLQVMIAEIPRHLVSQLGADYVAVDGRVAASASSVRAENREVQDYHRQLMQNQIRAEEEKGHIRLLATADLDLRSGEAVFLRAGGTFPLPPSQQPGSLQQLADAPDSDALPASMHQYRRFVLRPRFLARLQKDDRISLQAEFEVSSLTADKTATEIRKASGAEIAPLGQVRTVLRQVDMLPNQTIAFSGLLEEELGALSQQLPGLNELPVIGRLFGSAAYQQGYSDLVLLVTASLPQPELRISRAAQSLPPQAGTLYLLGHDWQPRPGVDKDLSLAPLPQPVRRAALQGSAHGFGHVIN